MRICILIGFTRVGTYFVLIKTYFPKLKEFYLEINKFNFKCALNIKTNAVLESK